MRVTRVPRVMGERGLFSARGAGRVLAQRTQEPPLRDPLRRPHRGPDRRYRLPSGSDAHAVSRDVVTSCRDSGGGSP